MGLFLYEACKKGFPTMAHSSHAAESRHVSDASAAPAQATPREAAATHPLFPGRKFISTVLSVLEGKETMSGRMIGIYLQRAAMAGFILGLFYTTFFTLLARFGAVGDAAPWMPVVGRVLACLTFGWSLILIYYTNSELLTSNMMVVSVGAYHHRIRWSHALRLLALCLIGNLIGGLIIAVLVRASTLGSGDVLAQMQATVEGKLAYLDAGLPGVLDLLARGILCNFCINAGMLMAYNGKISEDITKCAIMIVVVFLFAYLGLEHSVATSVLFLIYGLHAGFDIVASVIVVALTIVGNFIGGGLLIGINYAVMNDEHTPSAEAGAAEIEQHQRQQQG